MALTKASLKHKEKLKYILQSQHPTDRTDTGKVVINISDRDLNTAQKEDTAEALRTVHYWPEL
jgi:hypothetical protein